MKVLVVDDDLVSRRLLKGYLQKWDYQVTVVTNGVEAWKKFQEEDFPIVICDWMMPEMDGLELIQRMRSSDKPGYVYILLLTAKSRKDELVEGMQSGADDFVTKPFDHDELRMRLQAGARIVHLEQSLREAQAVIEGKRKD